MAALSIIKAPYVISWSRNPILFSFKVTPFTINDVNTRTRVQISLQVETYFQSNIFETVWTAVEYPDAKGFLTMDMSAVLDTKLEFYVPNKQYVKFHKCKKQVKKYRFTYSLINNDGQMVAPANSAEYYVVKGGLSKEQWHPSQFFEQNILVDQKMLHYRAPSTYEPLRTDQPQWLFFMMPAIASTYLKLVVVMTLESGGTVTTDLLEQSMSARTFEVLAVPVDYITLGIAALTPPGDICTNYSVSVWDDTVEHVGGGPVFRMDYRPMYEPVYLLYRNSLGGLDTQSFLGEKDFDIDVQKNKAEIVQLTDFMSAFNMQFESFTAKSFRAQKSKGNTGWISKQTADKLIDMFLDKQVYTPLGNKMLPVQIDTKGATLYKDVTKLYNLTLEWALAWLDENFSLANTVAQGDTCPAVFYFVASQVYGGKLHLIWKLEGDWEKIEVEYIIAGTPHTTTLIGNSGEVDIYISDPAAGTDKVVNVKARTVCNDETTPASYGPYTVQTTLTIHPRMTPIAVDDVADETYRGTGTRKLKLLGANMQILLNDIALNGGWGTFENFYDNVPVLTTTTNNGATVAYNVDDTIDYTPSGGSLAITDEDYVQYRFNENIPGYGTLISNYGKIRIPMKGQIPKVYVKIATLNVQQSFIKYGLLNAYQQQDVYVDLYLQFFKDAAMTIPVDVTSFGLVIAYETFQDNTPWSYTGSPTLLASFSVGTSTVPATGFSMPFLLNFHRIAFTDLGLLGGESIMQWHELRPALGTGNWEEVV